MGSGLRLPLILPTSGRIDNSPALISPPIPMFLSIPRTESKRRHSSRLPGHPGDVFLRGNQVGKAEVHLSHEGGMHPLRQDGTLSNFWAHTAEATFTTTQL
jgi:hypothetical protein